MIDGPALTGHLQPAPDAAELPAKPVKVQAPPIGPFVAKPLPVPPPAAEPPKSSAKNALAPRKGDPAKATWAKGLPLKQQAPTIELMLGPDSAAGLPTQQNRTGAATPQPNPAAELPIEPGLAAELQVEPGLAAELPFEPGLVAELPAGSSPVSKILAGPAAVAGLPEGQTGADVLAPGQDGAAAVVLVQGSADEVVQEHGIAAYGGVGAVRPRPVNTPPEWDAYPAHPPQWWEQFRQASENLDAATLTEGMADEIIPKIASPLLRREAEIAADVVLRFLNRAYSEELAERATRSAARLVATLDRLGERSTDDSSTAEAYALCHVLAGRFAEAATHAEPFLGTAPLLRIFVGALRLERFDMNLTVRLIKAGQRPADAIQVGLVVGKYAWWPDWLLKIVSDRALARTLTSEMITALDRCAYAVLSPAQARVARKLLTGDQSMIDAAAYRLEGMGELDAAVKLRDGDLTTVALTARLIPL